MDAGEHVVVLRDETRSLYIVRTYFLTSEYRSLHGITLPILQSAEPRVTLLFHTVAINLLHGKKDDNITP
jgi:hypothetical protein